MITTLAAGMALLAWIHLLVARGGFWRGREHDDVLVRLPGWVPAAWPRVTAVVPARNEAESIAACVGSLLAQGYPGVFEVLVVDDQSADGTAAIARDTAARLGADARLTVLDGQSLPAGWTGKLWAMTQGCNHLEARPEPADFILFSDADIAWGPDVLTRLVRGAESRGLGLVSLMAKLNCTSVAERWLVPAFIFFFQKLYPFAWVNDPGRDLAGAAGGCMLVRRASLMKAGGLARIRGALIDDCALGALMKSEGPIWLGLTERVVSIRSYPGFGDIRRMIVRSAYAELEYRPEKLLAVILGMSFVYVVPAATALAFDGPSAWLGFAAWLLMAAAFTPTLRFYGRNPLRALALPVIAVIYTGFTVESAYAHWLGRGGAWKGRYQAAGRAGQMSGGT